MRITCGKKDKVSPAEDKIRQGHSSHSQGRLSIIGIGPGDIKLLTAKAREAIERCDVIIGYKTYIKLLGNLTLNRQTISFGMGEEVERARCAIDMALRGKKVSVISSGDCGIYGMAGPVLEILVAKKEVGIKIEIIAGVPAFCSSAALLGAPLMNDFAVISLSDILTDLKVIERRIRYASQGDFVIVFYNPKSVKRRKPLELAWNILMKYRHPCTPVGIVRDATRGDEEIIITTLKDMLFKTIDMRTTIIVGNSRTYAKEGYMVTPRGYAL